MVVNHNVGSGTELESFSKGMDALNCEPLLQSLLAWFFFFFCFVKKLHTALCGGRTTLHPHQQSSRIPFSPLSLKHTLLLSLIMTILIQVSYYLIWVLVYISKKGIIFLVQKFPLPFSCHNYLTAFRPAALIYSPTPTSWNVLLNLTALDCNKALKTL